MTRRIERWFVTARCARVLLTVALGLVAFSCVPDKLTDANPESVLRSATEVGSSSYAARDVQELTIDLPDQPPSWTSDTTALIAAVASSNHRAFVAFKEAQSPAALATRRVEQAEPWNTRTVSKGTRAQVSARTVKAGLAWLESQGVIIHQYYDRLGIAYVGLDPSLAPSVGVNAMVDFIEPEGPPYQLAMSRVGLGTALNAVTSDITTNLLLVNAPTAWTLSFGVGGRLLIIDSGHERGHSELPLVPLGNCFGSLGGCDDALPSLHGTETAGVAVGSYNGNGIAGLAPSIVPSDLFFWGACNNLLPPQAVCQPNEINSALNWAAGNLGSRGVVNMSFGNAVYSSTTATAIAAVW